MQDALVTLVAVVVAIGAMVALYTVATSGQAYRELGKGGFDRPAESGAPAPPEDRDEEIRELLAARNARRARRREPPLDVEAQLAALTGSGAADASTASELRDELRALVVARNRRRAGAGLPALDVAAEVERRLRELT